MRDDLKQGLTAAAGVMLVAAALTLWLRHRPERLKARPETARAEEKK